MLNDLKYALRSLLRAPGFAIAAILTLALGIGANTAIFSVVDAVLLRPLPYPNSNRLVTVWDKLAKFNLPRRSPEYHTADAYRRLDNVFESTGGFFGFNDILLSNTGSERVAALDVSKEVFEMLAPRAVVGRTFLPDEYRRGAERVVMLGHSLFMRRFGGDPSIVGKSIHLGETSRRVVGIMAPDFGFTSSDVDVWIPVPLDTKRSWGNATRMIALLKPGVSLKTAQAALDVAAKNVEAADHPYAGPHGEDAGYSAVVTTLHETLLGEFRTITWILLCAVAAVLLIACVNVANLLLARAVAREKETAVRRALGATAWRLIAQWLTESAVLAFLGGACGTVAAIWGLKILLRLSPLALPGVAKISIDGRALLFTVAICALACVLFGLTPGIWRVAPMGVKNVTRQNRRAASLLITGEVALAAMLMIGAGLLLKSFSRLIHVDPGFNPSHLLILRADFNRGTFPPERVKVFSEIREKLAAIPGVSSATVGAPPVNGGGINAGSGDPFGIRGKSYDTASGPVTQFANLTSVGLDYFKTFEIPLRAGRTFAAGDITGDYPKSVIVNETLARNFFTEGAIGQEIGVPPPCTTTKCDFVWMTIIGVVGDVKTRGLDMATKPQIYIPQPGGGGFILRTAGDPLAMVRSASTVIQSVDSDLTVYSPQTMEDRIWSTVGQPRFEAALVGFFATAALFLAAIGIFGVVAHSTAQRTQEIGIRMALGADARRVLETVMVDGLWPVAAGLMIGVAGALTFSRILGSILFGVTATDPASFALATALLALVAILACFGPARHATRIDPAVALRSE